MSGRPTTPLDFVAVREALEASWSSATSYGRVWNPCNPALGQCYPTARVVQHFLPATEVVRGTVWTGTAHEAHYWSTLWFDGQSIPIDLTWHQFPSGSAVSTHEVLDRANFEDSPPTVTRCNLLLSSVLTRLSRPASPPASLNGAGHPRVSH